MRPPVVRPPVGRPPRPWYPGHPSHPSYRPGHWWRWATAATVTGWVVHRWANPIYYRYGSGGNVYYENNVVYVNGQQYGSADQYYKDTTQVAVSVPEMTDEQAAQMDGFADCILNDRTSPVDGYEGLRDMRIIAAIYKSIETGVAVDIA